MNIQNPYPTSTYISSSNPESNKEIVVSSATSQKRLSTDTISINQSPLLNKEISIDYKNPVLSNIQMLALMRLDRVNKLLKNDNKIKYIGNEDIEGLVFKTCKGTEKIHQLGLTKKLEKLLKSEPVFCCIGNEDQVNNGSICFSTLAYILKKKFEFELEILKFENYKFEEKSNIMIEGLNPLINDAINQFEQIKENSYLSVFRIFMNPELGCIAKYLKTREYFGGHITTNLKEIISILHGHIETTIRNMAADYNNLQNLIECFCKLKQLPKTQNNMAEGYKFLQSCFKIIKSNYSIMELEQNILQKKCLGNPLKNYSNYFGMISKLEKIQSDFSNLLQAAFNKPKQNNLQRSKRNTKALQTRNVKAAVPPLKENILSNQESLKATSPISTEQQQTSLQSLDKLNDVQNKITENLELKPEKEVAIEKSFDEKKPLEIKERKVEQIIPQLPIQKVETEILLPNSATIENEIDKDAIEAKALQVELNLYFEATRRFIEKDREKKQKLIQEKQEEIQRAILQKKEARKVEVLPIIKRELEVIKLNDDHIKTLKAVFNTKLPDFSISGDEVKNLIETGLKGEVSEGKKNKKHIHFAGSLKKAGEYEVAHQSDRGYLTSGWANRVKDAITYAIQKPLIAIEPSLELELFGEIIRKP